MKHKLIILLILTASILPHKVKATTIVYDTITELVVNFNDGSASYFDLEWHPIIVFKGDSVFLSIDTTSMVYYHENISKYHYRKRIGAVHIDSTVCPSNLPLVWNGISFTESGTQTLIIPAVVGGDSSITMTLTVKSESYTLVNDTIVENTLPYTIGNNTYDNSLFSSISYHTSQLIDTIILSNTYGCDSIVIVNLTLYNNIDYFLYDTICENSLPFSWNGMTFDSSGIQSVTLLASNGADSIINYTLTVNPVQSQQVSINITENQLPFIFADRSYNTSQHDTIVLQNMYGCDSSIFLNLTVFSNQTIILDSTICENELPIIWNDSIFYQSGIKEAHLQTVQGADSIIVMHLNVNPTSYSNISQTILQNNLPYIFNGQSYTADDFDITNSNYTIQDTIIITSLTGCDSVIYYTLNVIPNITIYIDTTVCEDVLPIIWNDSIFYQSGIKETHLQTVQGADSIIVMHLNVTPTSYSNISETILQNNLPYIFNGQSYTTNDFDITNGNYTIHDTIIITSITGCDSIIYYALTMIPNIVIYADTTVCESMLPFVWNGIIFNEAGTNEVVLTASTGADSTIVMNLILIPTTYSYFADSVYESQLPYIFMDNTYNASVENDTILLTSSFGCDSILIFSLTVIADSTIGITDAMLRPNYISYSNETITVNPYNPGGILYLYSVDGRLLTSKKILPYTTTKVSLDAYPAGVYLFRFNNITLKIVKI